MSSRARCEQADWTPYISKRKDNTGLIVKKIDDYIGKGVFAKKVFEKGDFLLEYYGELITRAEGKKKERTYPNALGSYLYFFTANGRKLCVDATFSKCKARYVNDSPDKTANACMKLIFHKSRPALCLFAKSSIAKGEEVRYDYGVNDLPWRRKKHTKEGDNKFNDNEGHGCHDMPYRGQSNKMGTGKGMKRGVGRKKKSLQEESNVDTVHELSEKGRNKTSISDNKLPNEKNAIVQKKFVEAKRKRIRHLTNTWRRQLKKRKTSTLYLKSSSNGNNKYPTSTSFLEVPVNSEKQTAPTKKCSEMHLDSITFGASERKIMDADIPKALDVSDENAEIFVDGSGLVEEKEQENREETMDNSRQLKCNMDQFVDAEQRDNIYPQTHEGMKCVATDSDQDQCFSEKTTRRNLNRCRESLEKDFDENVEKRSKEPPEEDCERNGEKRSSDSSDEDWEKRGKKRGRESSEEDSEERGENRRQKLSEEYGKDSRETQSKSSKEDCEDSARDVTRYSTEQDVRGSGKKDSIIFLTPARRFKVVKHTRNIEKNKKRQRRVTKIWKKLFNKKKRFASDFQSRFKSDKDIEISSSETDCLPHSENHTDLITKKTSKSLDTNLESGIIYTPNSGIGETNINHAHNESHKNYKIVVERPNIEVQGSQESVCKPNSKSVQFAKDHLSNARTCFDEINERWQHLTKNAEKNNSCSKKSKQRNLKCSSESSNESSDEDGIESAEQGMNNDETTNDANLTKQPNIQQGINTISESDEQAIDIPDIRKESGQRHLKKRKEIEVRTSVGNNHLNNGHSAEDESFIQRSINGTPINQAQQLTNAYNKNNSKQYSSSLDESVLEEEFSETSEITLNSNKSNRNANKTKHERKRMICYLCEKHIYHLLRHLRNVHGKDVHGKYRNAQKSDAGYIYKICPFPHCNQKLARLRPHLRDIHGVDDNEMRSLLVEAKRLTTNLKGKNIQSDTYTKGQRLDKNTQNVITSLTSSSCDEEPDDKIQSPITTNNTEKNAKQENYIAIPLLRKFIGYLQGPGPFKAPKNAFQHARQVLNVWLKIRRTSAFEPEDMLNIKRIKDLWMSNHTKTWNPGTTKSYIGSLLLFLRFLINRDVEWKEKIPPVMEELRGLTKDMRRKTMERRTVIETEDANSMIDSEMIKRFLESDIIQEIEMTLQSGEIRSLNRDTFVKIRNYLMIRILISNGQRPGALIGITPKVIQKATVTEDGATLVIAKHKTAFMGAAAVGVPEPLWTWLNKYMRFLNRQPLYNRNRNENESIFVTYTSFEVLSSSLINKGIQAIWQQVMGNNSTITATKLRKSIVTNVRKVCPSSRDILAAHMNHQPTTADRYYNISSKVSNALSMSKFISSTMTRPRQAAIQFYDSQTSDALDDGSRRSGEDEVSRDADESMQTAEENSEEESYQADESQGTDESPKTQSDISEDDPVTNAYSMDSDAVSHGDIEATEIDKETTEEDRDETDQHEKSDDSIRHSDVSEWTPSTANSAYEDSDSMDDAASTGRSETGEEDEYLRHGRRSFLPSESAIVLRLCRQLIENGGFRQRDILCTMNQFRIGRKKLEQFKERFGHRYYLKKLYDKLRCEAKKMGKG